MSDLYFACFVNISSFDNYDVSTRGNFAYIEYIAAGRGNFRTVKRNQIATYYNHLAAWVRRCGTVEEVQAVLSFSSIFLRLVVCLLLATLALKR